MKKASIVLIAMPWNALDLPSIQLGTLQAVLNQAGIESTVRSFNLALMEYLISSTADQAPEQQIKISDYNAIASEYWSVGMGDWIFAVPPYRDFTPEDEEDYLTYLRSTRVPDEVVTRAVQMRRSIPAFLDYCANDVLEPSPDIVGFTSSFSQNVPSLALAKLIKQRAPEVFIVFGGANCDGPMGAALHRSFPWVDAVVRGEGEIVLPKLVNEVVGRQPLSNQPGLCYWRNGESVIVPQEGAESVSMDTVPMPDYDEYFSRLSASSFRQELSTNVRLLFESSRGCWWGEKMHCTFCGLNGLTMSFRSKSPQRVMNEISTLSRRHKQLFFEAVDNIIDMHYLQTLLPMLSEARKAGFDFRLFYETKSNLKKEQIRLMRNAGIHSIQPGIESLSSVILKLMKKGVTALHNIRLLKWAAQYGVKISWNLIYGFPGEPPDEYGKMADVAKSLVHLQPPHLCPLIIDRFSPYQQRPAQNGLELTGPSAFYRYLYHTDEATLNDLAYSFDYRYLDGRKPLSYIKEISEAIEFWRENYPTSGIDSLVYQQGPGFMKITDRRPGLGGRNYNFDEMEAMIYLSCDSGASPSMIWRKLSAADRSNLSVDEIKEFLDELVEERLAYEEDGRYLSLALSTNQEEEKPLIGSEFLESLANEPALVQIVR
jgi:ribosomal peptide maturation radical SAM protein 1